MDVFDQQSHLLISAFRDSVREAFSYLETQYKFTRHDAAPRLIRYVSSAVEVTVHHGSTYSLEVAIGLIRSPERSNPLWARWIDSIRFGMKRRGIDSERAALANDSASPYQLQAVIGALANRQGMPSVVRERLESGNLFFNADNEVDVRIVVEALAELTRVYGDPVLRGDLEAFKRVSEYAHGEGAALVHVTHMTGLRKLLLRRLPPDVADRLAEAPFSELLRAEADVEKQTLLAAYPEEYGGWRDLPADEFMQRYWGKKFRI
jgi:hypothetical protein